MEDRRYLKINMNIKGKSITEWVSIANMSNIWEAEITAEKILKTSDYGKADIIDIVGGKKVRNRFKLHVKYVKHLRWIRYY